MTHADTELLVGLARAEFEKIARKHGFSVLKNRADDPYYWRTETQRFYEGFQAALQYIQQHAKPLDARGGRSELNNGQRLG